MGYFQNNKRVGNPFDQGNQADAYYNNITNTAPQPGSGGSGFTGGADAPAGTASVNFNGFGATVPAPSPQPAPLPPTSGPHQGSGMSKGPTEGPLSGPGYLEDVYKEHGKDLFAGNTASEDLYAQGAAGSNPFYDYAQQQTTKAINDAAAARGNWNSSYTMRNIGTAVADLRGQQAHELGQLAGQADQGRFGRYDRGFDFADRAQRAMENRARGGLEEEERLARGRSGLTRDFYGEAGRESQQAYMAKVETMLKESGMSLEEQKMILDTIAGGAEVYSSLKK